MRGLASLLRWTTSVANSILYYSIGQGTKPRIRFTKLPLVGLVRFVYQLCQEEYTGHHVGYFWDRLAQVVTPGLYHGENTGRNCNTSPRSSKTPRSCHKTYLALPFRSGSRVSRKALGSLWRHGPGAVERNVLQNPKVCARGLWAWWARVWDQSPPCRITYTFRRVPPAVRRLPGDVLQKIFLQLDNVQDVVHCAQVSQTWRQVAFPLIRRGPLVYPPIQHTSSHIFWLESLYQRYAPVIVQQNVQSFLQRYPLPGLRHLTTIPVLNSAGLPHSWLLADYGYFVRSMDLSRGSARVTDNTLEFLAQYCPNLVNLDLSDCYRLTTRAFQRYVASVNQLRNLTLDRCPWVEDSTIAALAQSPNRIYAISVVDATRMTDQGFGALMKYQSELRKIIIAGCTGCQSTALQSLGRHCRKLQWVDLSRLPYLKHQEVVQLVTYCTDLKRLNLAQSGAQHSPHVTHHSDIRQPWYLSQALGHPQCINDTTLRTMATQCPNLRVLDLSYIHTISNQAIHAIADGCPRLGSLNIIGCLNINHHILQTLSHSRQRLGQRLYVTLGDSPAITEEDIAHLAQNPSYGLPQWHRTILDHQSLQEFMDTQLTRL
ncbi:hypothetical protein IWQ62_002080 [Dispira parvispora]|uniref:F-box domain-containing protein n=1 Tax=Dispira parvispora TaxID=1520584 RepID=A0A9W8AWF4_9FUNG|nr:hypothetical protein IWQ62_002080 [Dispira parvispora]